MPQGKAVWAAVAVAADLVCKPMPCSTQRCGGSVVTRAAHRSIFEAPHAGRRERIRAAGPR